MTCIYFRPVAHALVRRTCSGPRRRALLSFAAVVLLLQFSEGWPSSFSHAGAQGSCMRARSRACCGVSCAAWPARPAGDHFVVRLPICLPLAARTHPSQMWYSTHVASAGFVSSVPACPPVQAVEQWCPMASLSSGEPLLSFKDLQGHELLTFSSLLWRRYMEPEPLLSLLRLRPRVTFSPSCTA